MNFRPRRVDKNQLEISHALVGEGYSVVNLSSVGGGVSDLIVAHPDGGALFFVEVKNGLKAPAHRGLTPAQIEWRAKWKGPVPLTVRCVEEALCALGSVDCRAMARHNVTGIRQCGCGTLTGPAWLDDLRPKKKRKAA